MYIESQSTNCGAEGGTRRERHIGGNAVLRNGDDRDLVDGAAGDSGVSGRRNVSSSRNDAGHNHTIQAAAAYGNTAAGLRRTRIGK